jgi:carbon-monoxide dehydrogenase medium subunit
LSDFDYAAAATVDEAVSLLAARGERAAILTGGTDLLVQLRQSQRQADLVVDVKKIPELMEIAYSPSAGLRLGAAVPCTRIYGDQRIVAAYPALVDAARIIGGWQIQSRASIGGNLCNSSPAADSVPTLIAYDATCQVAGPKGRRTVAVAEFCTAPGRNVLGRGELLAALEFPPPLPHASAAYLRFIPRNEMDIAVVGAASWVRLNAAGDRIEQARIALAAVAPTPVRAAEASAWLVGRPATLETFAAAGELAKKSASPISDKRGTAEYRLHLVGVLTRRTLAIAVDRARQGSGGPKQ